MEELFQGFGYLLLYFLICASLALVIRVKSHLPDEVFRKLLHSILLGSLLVWVLVYPHWWTAVAACVIFVAAIYPILWLLERVKGFSQFITERKNGELKASLVQVFGMFALVMTLCWGIFGDKLLVLASVYAWGFGDAAAALVGKRYGRHRFRRPTICQKSWEGTGAMFATSFVSVLTVLLLRGGLPWVGYLIISLITAAVSALLELFSKNGHDTFICPLGAMVTLLALLACFGCL